ncbi:MAG: glutathione S-transferase N-terminal domain-containing protein [Bacteriovoracaceae bacterium]|nr:glutathione S-transferase N-terminal domain-containing protein [Bacteriovoracaceae bacterium]
MITKQLTLYYFDECPFCQRVLKCINKLHLKVSYVNIMQDPAGREKLLNDTGKKTVPCLYIDNHPMFESSDIIHWLEKNAESLAKE